MFQPHSCVPSITSKTSSARFSSSAAKTTETRDPPTHTCLLSARKTQNKFGSCLTLGTSICIEQRDRSTRRESWLSSPSRQAPRGNDRIGPRNTRKDAKISVEDRRHTFSSPSLSTSFRVLRVFRGLKECEAKNCSNGLEVARNWPGILCCHVLRTFAGPSDSFSDEVAD